MEKLFRCDICGKVDIKGGKCCGEDMKDLSSSGCMGCRGCGHHDE